MLSIKEIFISYGLNSWGFSHILWNFAYLKLHHLVAVDFKYPLPN